MKIKIEYTVDVDYDAYCLEYGLDPQRKADSAKQIREMVTGDAEDMYRHHLEAVLQLANAPSK